MKPVEIERKFLIDKLPENLTDYECRKIEQAYLCTEPVIRIRREDDSYYLTYKGKGLEVREEYNLPLTRESYEHLLPKADGNILTKKRYRIPYSETLTIEVDVYEGKFEGLRVAELEFPSREEADAFTPPDWFGEDVTQNGSYQNSALSRLP